MVQLPAVMAELLLFSFLIFSIQQSSSQVLVSSVSLSEPATVHPPVSSQASSTVTLYSTEVSAATSSPLDRNNSPISYPADGLAALDGSVTHSRSNGYFKDRRGREEEVMDVEGQAARPEKETQAQGNGSISDPQDIEETSQDVKVFVYPPLAYPTSAGSQPITNTTPSMLDSANSISGMDRAPSSTTVGLHMTVSTVSLHHKQSNTAQGATPSPMTNTSSDHIHSLNSTVRAEAGSSGLNAWRPAGKTEEHQQFAKSNYRPLPTVATTQLRSTVTMAIPGEGQASSQPQGQTQSDIDPVIVAKALTSPTLTWGLKPRPPTPSTSTWSPNLQSTTYMVTVKGMLAQTTGSVHRAGKGENSGEVPDHSTSKLQRTGGHTATVTSMTPLRNTPSTTTKPAKKEENPNLSPSPPLKIGGRSGKGSLEKNVSGTVGHPLFSGPTASPTPSSASSLAPIPATSPAPNPASGAAPSPATSPAPSPAPSPTSSAAPSPREPCSSGLSACMASGSSNGTWLLWRDLQATLSFAWELHVYGTAGLFLLLAAGALLGLLLSPGLHCPHRGCLGLANALLLLAGVLRAAHFFIDPYGSREVLPHPGVAALYNLPLALLVWAQAALALLALRGAGLTLLPPSLQRLPLVAMLVVLHCTLLLAADLMSPALSPAVLVVLQTLSLSWGLGLCLGFFFYAFPRLRRPVPPPAFEEHASRVEDWRETQRSGRVLGRVLAVCACLGALCCGLHMHATLWLYGLLGDWRKFSWAWWLVQFWARLLELAWAFSMLLMASWVFWKPWGHRGDPGLAEGQIGTELPSSSSSSSSMQRHTCWAKIVQSLRGRPCRKSESNGVGGSGAGELPNNWAGQERPGADISKSLIRNRDPPALSRSLKDSNRGRNQKGGASCGSAGSLLRLQSMGQPPMRLLSSSLERAKEWALEKESMLSLNDFDLRPPSPIDLSRSIDEALHKEHLLRGGSLFRPLAWTSPPSPGPLLLPLSSWPRRSSDPQINLSDSSGSLALRHTGRTEADAPLGGSIASRQVTAPPTPTHMGCRLAADSNSSVPSSVSCPSSLRPSHTPVLLLTTGGEGTRPFVTVAGPVPDVEKGAGSSFLEVSHQEDSTSVSSEIIDL